MSSGNYVASFMIDPSGELIPNELSPQALESRKVAIVIDETSKKIYLWLGKGSTQNNRMGARRIVRSIPIFGLKREGAEFPLGRDCKIVEIEESLVSSDNSARISMEELEALLKKPHTKYTAGIWRSEGVSPAVKGETKSEAKILERRLQYEESHLEKETIAKSKKSKEESGR